MNNYRLSQLSVRDKKRFNTKLLGVLNKIMEICEENKIRWFVGYGACIGAIRHKGFIPWDDDIDVCMPRPDYDRFVEICKKIDLGEYELESIDETPNYCHEYVRLNDKNSTMYFSPEYVYAWGVYVDIFPLDGAADGNVEEHLKSVLFWKKIFYFSRMYYSKDYRRRLLEEGRFRGYLAIALVSIFRSFFQKVSLNTVDKKLRKYPYEESEYCMFYVDVYGMRNAIPKKWVEETIFVPFENIQVRIPKYYDEYLTHIYGDYMTPPPVEKRYDRHDYLFVDLDRRLTVEEIKSLLSE